MLKVNEKLERELNKLKEKAIELESEIMMQSNKRNGRIEDLEIKLKSTEIENEELYKQVDKLRDEYEYLIRDKEISQEVMIESKERVLEDLIEKHNLLSNEVNKISLTCDQFNDPNFIYHCLSNWDIFYLNKFLVELNNHIHEK
jgi:hypothetical protein